MTAPPDDAQHVAQSVALEIERLRRSLDVGLARIDGRLDLLVQRVEQTDNQLGDHEQRLDTLERARWPLPSIAVLIALVGVLLSAWQMAR